MDSPITIRALVILVLDAGPAHGLELRARIAARTGGAVTPSESTVHSAIASLGRDRLIEEEHALHRPTGGRPRRFWRWTEAGRAADLEIRQILAAFRAISPAALTSARWRWTSAARAAPAPARDRPRRRASPGPRRPGRPAPAARARRTPQDRDLHRYAIYLDAFDARLGNGNDRPRLLAITVDERLAAALGTLDASQASRDGAVLTGRFEHQRELHRLLHEDDAEGEEQ